MPEESVRSPKVFISYSHDSSDHKRWVADLAAKLRANGVDAILDQWDLDLGDDVPKFMEKSVTEATRVLMICTEKYVRKADEGTGGVGYEAMIVTGELVQNLGTSKFIPVIRQGSANPLVPKSVKTRLYVNLSHAQNYQEQFDHLLRQLHNAPRNPKPPLGQNPYTVPPSTKEGTASTVPTDGQTDSLTVLRSPHTSYIDALQATRRDDFIAWRALIRDARKPIPEGLIQWRTKYERLGLPSRRTDSEDIDKLMNSAEEGIAIYAPLFSIALAGVASGKAKYNNQSAILDDILFPKRWNRSGSTDIVYLPESAAFVYQALHGATCLNTEQLNLATHLANEWLGVGTSADKLVPLHRISEIIGWPYSLGRDARIAWDFLWQLPKRWEWLLEVYGDEDDYWTALCAYYMALNILDFVETIIEGRELQIENGQCRPSIPIYTPLMPIEIVRRGYRLLLNSPEQVRDIWRSRKVSEDIIKRYWIKWISVTARSFTGDLPFGDAPMIHERLLDDLP